MQFVFLIMSIFAAITGFFFTRDVITEWGRNDIGLRTVGVMACLWYLGIVFMGGYFFAAMS